MEEGFRTISRAHEQRAHAGDHPIKRRRWGNVAGSD
jgi:hypothetical protein